METAITKLATNVVSTAVAAASGMAVAVGTAQIPTAVVTLSAAMISTSTSTSTSTSRVITNEPLLTHSRIYSRALDRPTTLRCRTPTIRSLILVRSHCTEHTPMAHNTRLQHTHLLRRIIATLTPILAPTLGIAIPTTRRHQQPLPLLCQSNPCLLVYT